MKKFFIVLSLFSFLYILNGCDSSTKPATGFEDEIYVVADSLEFEELKVAIQAAFEVEINTPMPEKLFIIKRVSSNLINKIPRIIDGIAYLSVKIFIYFTIRTQSENFLFVIN